MAEARFEKSKVLSAALAKEELANKYLEAAKSGALGFKASQEGSRELSRGEMMLELAQNIIVMIEHSDDSDTVVLTHKEAGALFS